MYQNSCLHTLNIQLLFCKATIERKTTLLQKLEYKGACRVHWESQQQLEHRDKSRKAMKQGGD